MTCAFKDILGKPREGVHSLRVLGLAAVDLALTAVLAVFLVGRSSLSALLLAFFGLWGVGTLLHFAFCVDTPVTDAMRGVTTAAPSVPRP